MVLMHHIILYSTDYIWSFFSLTVSRVYKMAWRRLMDQCYSQWHPFSTTTTAGLESLEASFQTQSQPIRHSETNPTPASSFQHVMAENSMVSIWFRRFRFSLLTQKDTGLLDQIYMIGEEKVMFSILSFWAITDLCFVESLRHFSQASTLSWHSPFFRTEKWVLSKFFLWMMSQSKVIVFITFQYSELLLSKLAIIWS